MPPHLLHNLSIHNATHKSFTNQRISPISRLTQYNRHVRAKQNHNYIPRAYELRAKTQISLDSAEGDPCISGCHHVFKVLHCVVVCRQLCVLGVEKKVVYVPNPGLGMDPCAFDTLLVCDWSPPESLLSVFRAEYTIFMDQVSESSKPGENSGANFGIHFVEQSRWPKCPNQCNSIHLYPRDCESWGGV
jgi:hypothetical protein